MQEIEGALLDDEPGQIIRTELFSDLDLLGVIRFREPNRFISTLHQRSDTIEVPRGGSKLIFWVEISGIEAMSGSLEDALSHLMVSAKKLNA
jgi:hypothetical protein